MKAFRLYISGPMTGFADFNYPAFFRAERGLILSGYTTSNPAQYDPVPGETWEDCLKRDLVDMFQCDGVATLPGWKLSRGARFEVRTARTLGMPVMPAKAWTIRATQLTLPFDEVAA